MYFSYTFTKKIQHRGFTYKIRVAFDNGFVINFEFYASKQTYERLLKIIKTIENDKLIDFDGLIKFSFARYHDNTLKFYNVKSSLFREDSDPKFHNLSECKFKIRGYDNIKDFFLGLKEVLSLTEYFYNTPNNNCEEEPIKEEKKEEPIIKQEEPIKEEQPIKEEEPIKQKNEEEKQEELIIKQEKEEEPIKQEKEEEPIKEDSNCSEPKFITYLGNRIYVVVDGVIHNFGVVEKDLLGFIDKICSINVDRIWGDYTINLYYDSKPSPRLLLKPISKYIYGTENIQTFLSLLKQSIIDYNRDKTQN